MADDGEYSQFLAVHRGQLEVSSIPVQFWKALHEKLKNEVSCFWKIESNLVLTNKSIAKNVDARGMRLSARAGYHYF